MNNFHDRITSQTATELFALAAQLQGQKSHDYAPSELLQAATEAGISPDNLQEALQILRSKQTQDKIRHRNLRLILGSGVAGIAIALTGVWAYFTLNQQSAIGRQAMPAAIVNSANLVAPDGDAVTYTGTVQQYLLNPEGKVEGLLLKNGLQVKFPPHLSKQLTNSIALGAEVRITGIAGTATRFGQEVRAIQIGNQHQQTIVAESPTTPPLPPVNKASYTSLSAEGTAQHWLVGHRGELNGLILASGVEVKFPPHVGEQLIDLIRGNDKIQVRGFGSRNSYGEVIEATELTANGQNVAIAPPLPTK
ncbi:hypothetical protein I8752_28965 [Nostocaceae cyanobacterium CENA369]|uniref:DUF5666 domain-containing protein n=1 Tax=Dendronalium phyllosphericum CENA369 TaxID=1725256 RepID=A0A8J7LID7_9NOST|nr:hypothetical protein [Dendronalium phyllosphericum]MBH8576943.1 hypothetical protein [Dendronalium phyllosphericum CENA369]